MAAQTLQMEQKDHAWLDKALSEFNFFKNLTMDHLATLLSGVSLVAYPKGTAVFSKGEPGRALFVVYEGEVAVKVPGLLFDKTVATLGSGKIFGEMALLKDEPRSATVAAATDAKVFVIMADAFRKIAEQNAELRTTLEKLVFKRSSNVE